MLRAGLTMKLAIAVAFLGRARAAAPLLDRVDFGSGEQDRFFGAKVALSGDGRTLAVAAQATSQEPDSEDVVAIFVRQGEDWWPQFRFAPRTAQAGGDFGASLALSETGDTLFIGAPRTPGPMQGRVEAWVRVDGAWRFETDFRAPPASQPLGGEVSFGRSLAVSADGLVLAIGCPGTVPVASARDATGAVVVWRKAQGLWHREAVLEPTAGGVDLGGSVAVSEDGRRILAGVNFGGARRTGAAAVFERDDAGAWRDAGMLEAPATEDEDLAGTAREVAMSGTTAVVATIGDQSALYVWRREATGGWAFQQKLRVPAEGTRTHVLGSVAMRGDVLVAGSALADFHSGAFVFMRRGQQWDLARRIQDEEKAPEDTAPLMSSYGASVALGGADSAVVAVGDPRKASLVAKNAGSAYVYQLLGGGAVGAAAGKTRDSVDSASHPAPDATRDDAATDDAATPVTSQDPARTGAGHPLCANGIRAGDACCAASCGVCGGLTCADLGSDLFWGASYCCPETIRELGDVCNHPTDVGCRIVTVA